MHLHGRSICVTLAVSLSMAAAAVVPAAALASSPTVHDVAASIPTDAEVRHFHAHLDSVLTDLRAENVTSLSALQQFRRHSIIESLARYETGNEFPHNYDFPDAPTPYFRDRKTGALCAVAHLLATTGRRDIVDRVARTDNNVWVAELAGDSAFVGWLASNGLSMADAAHIQVPYATSPTSAVAVTTVGVAALASFATAGVTSVWNATGNANGHHKKLAILGIVAGAVAASTGSGFALQSSFPSEARKVFGVGALLGGVSMAVSTRALLHRSAYLADKRDGEAAERKRAAVETSISPIIPIGRNSGAGVNMQIRF